MTSAPVLEVTRLHKSFPGVKALSHVHLRLFPGEIHALMGQNGAGKSTLIKVLTGLYTPDAGRITLDGQAIAPTCTEDAQALGIRTVYQEVNLCPNLSVAENICAGRFPRKSLLQGRRIDWAAVRAEARRVLGQMDLDIDVTAPLSHYSLSVQQMVAIARALRVPARVLILDEPASGLDPAQRVEIRHLVRELAQGDVTVILSTHVLPEVEAICDRAIIINEGRIVASDTLDGLSQAGVSVKLTVARPDDALLQQLRGLSGVQSVRDMSGGTYVVTSERDVRAEAASIAVAYDLLALSGQRGLEDAYLLATEAASSVGAAGQASDDDGGES